METNVEILVPSHSTATVREALRLGRPRSTWFAAEPSRRAAARLLVSWVADLESAERRRDLALLWHGLTASRRTRQVPVVFLWSEAGRGSSCWTGALLQALVQWSRLVPQEPYIAPDANAVRRLVLARQSGAERELIASASIDDGRLVVWSCEPVRYEVPISEVPALAKLRDEELADFEVSSSGSRLRWRQSAVDINLDTLRVHADPDVRRKHEREARKEAARYADAIRRFRLERGLTQTDIEGLTDRQVRRLEEGETIPQFETLKKLAAAHQLSINDYLAELAKRSRPPEAAKAARRRRARAR